MNLVDLPVDQIRFLPYNPNKMPDEKLHGLEASHKEWGVLQNVVVNDRRGKGWKADERGKFVVAGEHRLKVAKRQKLSTYPVLVVSVGPTEEQRMNLALNNAGTYDPVLLGQLLREIQKAKADLSVTGFMQAEIDLAIQELEKQIAQVADEDEIPTGEKPVELSRRAMLLSSRPGENVLDLFAGGGGTLIAAEETDRTAFLMELDPRYCDVIRERFENFNQASGSRPGAA